LEKQKRNGELIQTLPIDAATIRPRVDAYGWPGPDDEWYEQWILGVLIERFRPDELTYDGLWPVTDSPYFRSPVEYLITTTLSALKADEWNRSWLTDGNTPSDGIALPESWTPTMIEQFSAYFNSMLAGETKERQKLRFFPGGSQRMQNNGRKDQEFSEFELWLARRVGAIYGVQLASIGFAGEQYKVTQENSTAATTQFGAGSLLDIRKEHYDDLLEELGYEDLETINGADAAESPKDKTTRLTIACGGAYMKINEARVADGLDPEPDGDVLLVDNTVRPLEQAIAEPEPEPVAEPGEGGGDSSESEDINRWMRKALKRFKNNQSPVCAFITDAIPRERMERILIALARATTNEEIRQAFSA